MLHLNSMQVAQVERLVTLLDEAFYQSVKSNSLHQRVDGNVEFVISLGNTSDRARGLSKVETSIVVYSSMMVEGQTRHFYATLEEALEAVEKWHSEVFMITDQDVRVSQERPNLRVIK